jgi:hypothetical protein
MSLTTLECFTELQVKHPNGVRQSPLTNKALQLRQRRMSQQQNDSIWIMLL